MSLGILNTTPLPEHAVFPSLHPNGAGYAAMDASFPGAPGRLQDYGAGRLADMDSANVTIQVMSLVPGLGGAGNATACYGANDELASAAAAQPDRLAGLAVLPMADPAAAAAELQRAVLDLGLAGALIDNYLANMSMYDGEQYWPVWAMAQQLDVPIYLHPVAPPAAVLQEFYPGDYPVDIEMLLSQGGWGWHESTGLHFLKLYAAGVFDRFPRLKLVLGHMGEMVPFMLDRADRLLKMADRQKSVSQAWEENVWTTTSGMFSLNPMATLLKTTKVERIMYSIDYPFEDIRQGPRFLSELAASGLVTQDELDMIAYRNAKSLLKLQVP